MEFSDFSPVFVGLLLLRRAAMAALCSGVYSLGFRFGFIPSRNGYNAQPATGQSLTSLLLPQQQSRHLSRIAFSGEIRFPSMYVPPA
jgi:hypothetical protein